MLSSFIFVFDKLIILQQTDLLKKYICKERIFSSKKNPDLFLPNIRVLVVQFPSDVTAKGGVEATSTRNLRPVLTLGLTGKKGEENGDHLILVSGGTIRNCWRTGTVQLFTSNFLSQLMSLIPSLTDSFTWVKSSARMVLRMILLWAALLAHSQQLLLLHLNFFVSILDGL